MRFVDYAETNHVRMHQFADHPEWLALSEEARCVYALLRMHIRADGTIPIGYGPPEATISGLLRLDPRFTAIGLGELLEAEHMIWDRALGELRDLAHEKGETASWSPSFRQRRSRERTALKRARTRRLKHAGATIFPSPTPPSATPAGRDVPACGEGRSAGVAQIGAVRLSAVTPRDIDIGDPVTPRDIDIGDPVTPRDESVTPRDIDIGRPLRAVTPRDENVTPRDGSVTPRDISPHTVVVVVGSCSSEQQTTTTEGALARAPMKEQIDPALDAYQARLIALIEDVWQRKPRRGEMRTMQEWFDRGVDADFLLTMLSEEFERVDEGGQLRIRLPLDSEENPVMNLSFFRRKVLNAWRKAEQFQAPALTPPLPSSTDVPLMLLRIADALPERLPTRDRFAASILAIDGDVEHVERVLQDLETEVLRGLHRSLTAEEEANFADRLEAAFAGVADRVAEGEEESTKIRLYLQLLRDWFEMPVFSVL